jgi:tight adherence protein B
MPWFFENTPGDFLYWILVVGGSFAIFGAIFFFILRRYASLEKSTIEGISDYAQSLYNYFDLMFMRKSLNYCYGLIVGTTAGFGVLGFVLGINFGFMWGLILSVTFSLLGYRLPGIIIKAVFQHRLAKFEKQLVDALNMMANAIKSGLSFMQVIQLLEKELPKPASDEFAMVLKENRIGVNLNDALLNMTKRVPSDDLFMIMNSVVTLSQQGGDLSEAFETIAFTIRERQRVQEKIKTLAQAGLTQATILSLLPFGIMGMMYAMQPDQVMILFDTNLGRAMLAVMGLLIGIGALWMKKILTIEI